MNDQALQQINEKLDRLIEYVEKQDNRIKVLEDLAEDMNLIMFSANSALIETLEDNQVKVDQEAIGQLMIMMLRNMENFKELIASLENLTDLLKDLGYVFGSIGLNSIHTFAQWEEKGVFKILDNLKESSDSLLNILRKLTDPVLIQKAEKTLEVITSFEVDEQKDKKSLFGLMRELNRPQTRMMLSAMLRTVNQLNEELNKPQK